MDAISLERLLNEGNKFYWILNAIQGSQHNDTLNDMLKTLVPSYKDDINKPIIRVTTGYASPSNYNSRKLTINIKSVASEVFLLNFQRPFDWSTDTPSKILDYLIENGLDLRMKDIQLSFPESSIDEITNKLLEGSGFKEIESNSIEKLEIEPFLTLNDGFINQNRQCGFIGQLYKQLPKEVFLERLSKSNFLSDAVSKGQLDTVKFMFETLQVPINLPDSKLKTPLMSCRDRDVFDYFENKEGVNWIAADNLNNNALYYFGLLSSKDISKELISRTQKIITDLSKNDNSIADTIQESNRKTLLAIVNSQKTKEEVDSFLKSSKIKDFTGIVDEKGRSLSQLSIMSDSWGKFAVFKKGTSQEHRDSRGYSDLDYLLLKNNVKYPKGALQTMSLLLENVYPDTGFNVINRHFRQDRPISIPRWYLNKGNYLNFLQSFVGNDLANQFLDDFTTASKNHFINGSLSNVDPNNIAQLKEVVRPLIVHALNNGFANKINDLDLRKLCTIHQDKFTPESYSFKASASIICNVAAIVELAGEYNIPVDRLLTRFEDQACGFIKSGIEKVLKNPNGAKYSFTRDSFIRESSMLISFLIDMGSTKVIESFDSDYVDRLSKINGNLPLSKKIESYVLSVSLSNNEDFKPKKIKI